RAEGDRAASPGAPPTRRRYASAANAQERPPMTKRGLATGSIGAALVLCAGFLACGGRTADLGTGPGGGGSGSGGGGGSSSGGSSGGLPPGPSCSSSSFGACWSCLESACGSALACFQTDCSAYLQCYCACQPGD